MESATGELRDSRTGRPGARSSFSFRAVETQVEGLKEEATKLRAVQLDLVKETSELRGAYDHLAMKEDVAKPTLTQVKRLIGILAVPTVLTLINMIIQLTG